MMKEFDDNIPARVFDNFQVGYSYLVCVHDLDCQCLSKWCTYYYGWEMLEFDKLLFLSFLFSLSILQKSCPRSFQPPEKRLNLLLKL